MLLCEIDRSGDIAKPFGGGATEFQPREIEPGVFVMSMDTEKALQEYLHLNLKVPMALRLGPFARALDFVATAAPGVREILTIGKLCWDVKRETYDLVVVDAPATGHFVSQIASPDAISELVHVGPLVGQAAWMKEILRDPKRTGVIVTTTPEEMPVSETIELVGRLRTETRSPVAAIAVNRVLPELFVRNEVGVFSQLRDNLSVMQEAVRGDVAEVVRAASMGQAFRSTQVEHIDRLQTALPDEMYLFIPQAFTGADHATVMGDVAHALAAELDQ